MKNRQYIPLLCTGVLLSFLLGSYNGRLAVWKNDDPEPYRIYPCPVYLFPQKERDALQRGIRINNMDDLSEFLENFFS